LFSPQISPKSLSHSQNKATELKKREKRKRKVLKKKRERKKRAPKVSHEKG
jgi:nitric oxide reductase activation protein